jgi:hypothetical protein
VLLKLFIKFLLVIVPTALALGCIEYRLSAMNTHYFTKKIAFEKQLPNLEILSVGSSNAYFGINPEYFSYPGYNFALSAQSMYYDEALVMKYVDKMPKLKIVILPAIYYTMGIELDKTSEVWRTDFYQNYFHIPRESQANKIINLGWVLEPKYFSKISLYGKNVYSYYRRNFSDVIDYESGLNGWYDSSDMPPANLEENNGVIGAREHNIAVNTDIFDQNIMYWDRLIVQLKARHITPVLIQLPAHPSYYENLDPTKFALLKQKLQKLADTYNLEYHDYTKDPRFSIDEYTIMVDHANPRGAEKISRIINQDIVVPLMKKLH